MVRMSEMLRSTKEFKQKSEPVTQQQSSGVSQEEEQPHVRGITPPPPDSPGQGGTAIDLGALTQLASLLMPGGGKKTTPVPSPPPEEQRSRGAEEQRSRGDKGTRGQGDKEQRSRGAEGTRGQGAEEQETRKIVSVPFPDEKIPVPLGEETPPVLQDEPPVEVQSADPYAAAIACSGAVFCALREKRQVDTEQVVNIVRDMVSFLKGTDEYLLKAIHERRLEEYIAVHSTNVMIIAVKIGEAMKYTDDQLFLLGLTAFLHDLGMITVPDRKGAFTDEDRAQLMKHPNVTRDFIAGMGSIFVKVADIAAQEQEREDGSGYPAHLSGDQIHEFAKIIGVADTYEAITHSRAHREGLVAYGALKKMIDLRTSTFSRKIIRALIDVVSVYPLGSLIKLNTGAIGRVMMKSDTHPTRPTIRLLKDAQGKKIDRLINLEQEPMLYIADAQVAESEVEE